DFVYGYTKSIMRPEAPRYTCGDGNNNGQFCNKELDQYYEAGMSAPTQKAYDENMKKAMIIAMDNYATLPLYNYAYYRLVKPYVGGYKPEGNHMDHVYTKWLYFKK
ncbi:MAG: hypothetical protein ACO2ZM_04020, partial [Francisellaceae bacterium]